MLVQAEYLFEFESDTSDFADRFVDKKGIAKEFAEKELERMLKNGEITVDDFCFSVIDDGDDHPLD